VAIILLSGKFSPFNVFFSIITKDHISVIEFVYKGIPIYFLVHHFTLFKIYKNAINHFCVVVVVYNDN